MADIEYADAAGEVEEAIAVHVFEHGTLGACRENRRRMRYAARDGRSCVPPHCPHLDDVQKTVSTRKAK